MSHEDWKQVELYRAINECDSRRLGQYRNTLDEQGVTKMDKDQFEALADCAALGRATLRRDAARSVLVEGLTPAQASRLHAIHPTTVSGALTRIYNTQRDLPEKLALIQRAVG